MDLLALRQRPASTTASDPQASADVRSAVGTIGRTCVVCPAADPLLPFLRSWCVFEMALTPLHVLDIHIGWGVWDLSVHEELRSSVERLDVSQAEAFSPADKLMIDQLVQTKFGSLAEASVQLRRAIIRGFHSAAVAALGLAGNADAEYAMLMATGKRPLTDERIVAIWAA